MMTYTINRWITENELAGIFSANYWNDRDIESKKIWSIPNNDFQRLENYFLKKGLSEQLETLVKDADICLKNAIGASLGCGNCILESFLLNRFPQIQMLYCIEFSAYRLLDIAPRVLSYYQISDKKIELCFGSFYKTKIEDNRLDFVLLSQAFHHAADPHRLLSEVKRLLRPGGTVVIIGEHYFSPTDIFSRSLKHIIKWAIDYKRYRSKTTFVPIWTNLFPADPVKGDHHYRLSEYQNMFEKSYFIKKRYIFKSHSNQGFVLKAASK